MLLLSRKYLVVALATTLAILATSKPAEGADEMPGRCEESSDALPEGGYVHMHSFGATGARYTCGTNGCHPATEEGTLCHQHDHLGIN
jgi:hypothetical protein